VRPGWRGGAPRHRRQRLQRPRGQALRRSQARESLRRVLGRREADGAVPAVRSELSGQLVERWKNAGKHLERLQNATLFRESGPDSSKRAVHAGGAVILHETGRRSLWLLPAV
jgi:hypothetical protein